MGIHTLSSTPPPVQYSTFPRLSVLIAFAQHAERLSASRLVLVGADEWARGTVSVKDLAARDQKEMSVQDLLTASSSPAPAV